MMPSLFKFLIHVYIDSSVDKFSRQFINGPKLVSVFVKKHICTLTAHILNQNVRFLSFVSHGKQSVE